MKTRLIEGPIRRILKWMFPSLLMTRAESLEAIKVLQSKLNEARTSSAEWRSRALSAERVICHNIPQAIKKAVREHDQQHGTSLAWRM